MDKPIYASKINWMTLMIVLVFFHDPLMGLWNLGTEGRAVKIIEYQCDCCGQHMEDRIPLTMGDKSFDLCGVCACCLGKTIAESIASLKDEAKAKKKK